ncbi:MAG: helix-turn-helix domain-containing protein [Oscillospiraceae bacterium]|nr:helix-turn-helix domain-containing protein [Oscillospiraceae bacterium]
MSDSMGTKEAAELWGYKQSTIADWCRKGLIKGADQDGKGSPWHIPKDAKCPKPIKNKEKKV